ncbi:alanyl-tRNA synthetase, class IIc isoform X4 [Carex rostrata]
MEILKLQNLPLLCASSSHRRSSPATISCLRSYLLGCSCINVSTNQREYLRLPRRSNLRIWKSSVNCMASASVTREKEDRNEKENLVSGDAIRRRFLDFFASQGHKILPSSSLVPDDPTVFLTIAGMLQFKPIFLGKEPRKVACATTSQKCMRTNDIENVGRTARHHTFFEMLGNFSFGDYFKKEAILWAWELTTKEFGLPPEKLWISVFQDDDEAFSIWRNEVGVPEERIKRMGEEDNFWNSGVTGPCGPCSEMYYDFHPERGSSDADLGDDSRFIEFYNLVFMQYNKKEDGSLEPLKQKNIDTGMGLERMAQILQNVPNNYETDLIFPIIEKAAHMASISYSKADDTTKTNLKVIGDHMRAVVYLISDGVMPSNIGRGYVVRRLIRRVVRTGRLIGIRGDGLGSPDGAFTPVLAETVIALSTEIDPDVSLRKTAIVEELKREELRFVQTLERGEKLLDQFLVDALTQEKPCLSGKDAFLLYDTYGFPVEITAEIASERGVTVNMKEFEVEMNNQRKQSQAAHNVVKLSVGNEMEIAEGIPDTEFLGYDSLSVRAVVKGILVNGNPVKHVSEGTEVEVLLDRTPFYAESGGQIGDNGLLYSLGDGNEKSKTVVEINDVQKSLGNIFVHKGMLKEGSLEVGKEIDASVDAKLRLRAKVHHTATHLLQSALKAVTGPETSQAGSLVSFDRLRFDFNFHRPLTDDEITEIEALVNCWISEAADLDTKVMVLADAKKAGAIAMFGEKYGEQVKAENVNARVESVLEELRATRNEVSSLKSKIAVLRASNVASKGLVVGQNNIRVVVENMDDTDTDALRSAAEFLTESLQDPVAIVLGSIPDEGKVSLVASFSPEVVKMGIQAGKFIGNIAKLCGGGGGGKPNFAQAGGRKPENLSMALERAKEELLTALSSDAVRSN